jgi:hypothetical protein
MFGHRPVGFVVDAVNFPAVFRRPNRSPKQDDRAGLRILGGRRNIERSIGD